MDNIPPTSTTSAVVNPRELFFTKLESNGSPDDRQIIPAYVRDAKVKSCCAKRSDVFRQLDKEMRQVEIMHGRRSLINLPQNEKSPHTCQTYSRLDICDKKTPTSMSEISSPQMTIQEYLQSVLDQKDHWISRIPISLCRGNTGSTSIDASMSSVNDHFPQALIDFVLAWIPPDHTFDSAESIDFKKIEDQFCHSVSASVS